MTHRPSALQSGFEHLAAKSGALCPLDHCERCAVVRDSPVLASVQKLLGESGPSDVSGFISTRIINPIKTVTRGRSLAYVREECCEVVFPFRAYLDPSGAVVLVLLVVGAIAAAFHAAPNLIFRSAGHAMRAALRAYHVWLETATTPRAGLWTKVVNYFFASAVASTEPPDHPNIVSGFDKSADDQKPAEALPSPINKPRHIDIIHGNCDVGADIPNGGAAMVGAA